MKQLGQTLTWILSFFYLWVACKEPTPLASVEKGFREIPDSIRVGCYWYWLSDNISKEGVINDLHAMKKAGITRTYIGNIGLEDFPYGTVRIFTPEWWEAIHAALKTAGELDIEVGMFNSPGWSQSGGPWVKPEQSMRYLTAQDQPVKGPAEVLIHVSPQDGPPVRVICYPAGPEAYARSFEIGRQDDDEAVFLLPVDERQTVRSLRLSTQDYFHTMAELQAADGEGFRTIRRFEIDRTNFQPNVGFDPFAPVVLSLPDTKTSRFRLLLERPLSRRHGAQRATVTLSSEPVTERYPEQSLAKMFQRPLPYWHVYMWERQEWYDRTSGYAIPPSQVRDVTPRPEETAGGRDGALKVRVPQGDWVLSTLRMNTTGVTNSPATPDATGLEVDKMSRRHVAAHFDAFMGEILRRVPQDDRRSLRVVVQDSYETGGQNWTDDMLERFLETYAYAATPYLPTLQGKVVGNEDVSSRFLWDLRRLVADRVAYDYVGGLTEVCHRYGLTTWLENYGHWGFPGEFLQYGGQSDEVSGEFWSVGELGDIENRAASSCAHIYGKKRVWAESCTSGGPNFGRYPADMKPRLDRFFTEGVNASLLHLYIHQPYEEREPGMSAWFGNDFQRKNTWFRQLDVFTDYLRRSDFLLQQGDYVADVAYFIGEDAPKMTGVEDPKLPGGYAFDFINAEVLMRLAEVREGCLTLPGGMRYRLLVLPDQRSMRPEVLRRIRELVHRGVAVYGSAPDYSPSLSGYPEADREVKRLGGELFAGERFGKGRVFRRGECALQEALDALGVAPDFTAPEDAPLLFIHRTTGGEGEVFYVSNQSERKVSAVCGFRATAGLQPELWHPVTGEMRRLPVYERREGGALQLALELEGYESFFVVFRKGGGRREAAMSAPNFQPGEVLCTVNTPWQVTFEAGRRGPDMPVRFDSLTDWKDSEDERIRYFSGEAVYSTVFTADGLPAAKELYLDIGKAMVMAKVKVNGQYVGGVWTMPYRLNVTDYLRSGENTLEITVVNNWQNRLTGDQRLPEGERPTWTTVNPWKADSPLQSSGLLGPVEILAYDYDVIAR
jgi:hypothetical protein